MTKFMNIQIESGLCSFNDKSIVEDILSLFMNTRNKEHLQSILHMGLYLYFSGLSLRRTSERLSCFIKRNHVSIWN